MKPRVIISFAIITVLLAMLVLITTGCSAQITKPYKCSCDCEEARFECSGVVVESEANIL